MEQKPEEIIEVLRKYHNTTYEQRTPAIVREALEWSIDHWKRMETGTQYEEEEPYTTDCALCQLYCSNAHHNYCNGCPVMNRTGCSGCNESPWEEAANEYVYSAGQGQSAKFKLAARTMRAFLESLREDI